MLTVLLASAVPARVGVVSFVVPVVVVKVGTAGGVVSAVGAVFTVKLTAVEAVEILPAASVAVAVKA